MKKSIATFLAATACAGFVSTATLADDDTNSLGSWQADAMDAVSETVSYPTVAARLGKEGTSSYFITIDREGEIVDVKSKIGTGVKSLDNAAWRTIKNTEFPALPESFSSDTMTFELALNYSRATNPVRDAYLANQNTNVVGTRIAVLDVEDID